MFRIILVFVLISFSISLADTETDSLLSLLEDVSEKEHAAIYNILAKKYLYIDMAKSTNYNDKALYLAKENSNSEEYAKAIHFKAVLLINKGSYPQALEYQFKALAQFEKLDMPREQAFALNNIGYLYSRFGQYGKALDYHNRSYIIREELNDLLGMTKSRSNIALMNYEMGEYEKSLEYELEALSVFADEGDTVAMIVSINSIGNIYEHLDSLTQAARYYERSLTLARQKGHILQVIPALNNLGNIHIRNGDKPMARRVYKECLAEAQRQGEKYFTATAKLNLGNLEILSGNYKRSIPFIKEAKKIFTEIEYNDMIVNSFEYLQKSYKLQGKYKTALAYADSAKNLDKKINSEELRDKISQLQAVMETEANVKELQKQLAVQKLEGQKKNLIILAIFGSTLAAIVIALLLYKHNRILETSRIEREKHIAELELALEKVRTLSGLIPICANCKNIRDDKGYWNQIESYIREHSDAEFTHGICPDCTSKLYPEYDS